MKEHVKKVNGTDITLLQPIRKKKKKGDKSTKSEAKKGR